MTEEQPIDLSQIDITRYSTTAWVIKNNLKNEKGDLIDLRKDHLFLYQIYEERSPNLVVMKAAQVGLSTCEILKNIHDAKMFKMDIIYTLPTDGDVKVFVGGKVNRIISNNSLLQEYTADKDSIEQKQIGESMIYFRGTWTEKAAIMVTADRLVHDEKDSSKQEVVEDYQARLQHSAFKHTHVFSHPSVPNNGVDIQWQLSDQKEWFIKCPHCDHEQFLSWNTEDPNRMSIDLERRIYICKKCGGELSNDDRAVGRWVPKHPGAKWSGYHVTLLMAPWVSAAEIIEKYNNPKQTTEYFYNKILGLPYAGSGNNVPEEVVMGAVTTDKNEYHGRMIIGVDTGIKLRYVIGNKQGLLGYGEMTDYMPDDVNKLPLNQTLEYFLKRFPDSVMVIDQGGDIIGSRKLAKKYPGRVFLCFYARDRQTKELVRFGTGKEKGRVLVDRNRMMQLTIDELKDRRWFLYNGTREDWYNYWLHWSHIYRKQEEDEQGIKTFQWFRSDRDDWVHATVYWRVGVSKFGNVGTVIGTMVQPEKNSYMINPNQTVSFDPDEMFRLTPVGQDDVYEEDWRLN